VERIRNEGDNIAAGMAERMVRGFISRSSRSKVSSRVHHRRVFYDTRTSERRTDAARAAVPAAGLKATREIAIYIGVVDRSKS